MDMNAIMKKLAVRKTDHMPSYQTAVTVGSFDHQQNTRYGGGHQPSMSFAGKKITAVSGSGAAALH